MSAQAPPEAAVEAVLAFADDELVLGWRDSEWTGVAPFLEEDVAFSSIAQGEIGHARALYELAAGVLGRRRGRARLRPRAGRSTVARPSSSSRSPATGRRRSRATGSTRPPTRSGSRRSWSPTGPSSPGLAAKMDREEAYHRMHARDVAGEARGESEQFEARPSTELWPYALGVLEPRQRGCSGERGRARGGRGGRARRPHDDGFAALTEEMTMVRRSVPGAAW